jgi:hypothetical protein
MLEAIARRDWAGYVLVAAGAVALGFGVTLHTGRVWLVIMAAGCAVAILAAVRPQLFTLLLGAALLFPYTWSPSVWTGAVPPVGLLILPAGLWAMVVLAKRGRLRLNRLDYCVVAIVLSALLSDAATGSGLRLTQSLAETLLLAYFAYRATFTAWPQMHLRLAETLVWIGAALSLLGVWEELHRSSPFTHSSLTNPALVQWTTPLLRNGALRVETTFGHPVAFGSFLIIPLLIAFAQKRWVMVGLIALGLSLTFSRGPYVAAILALFLLAWATRSVGRLAVLAVALALIAMLVGPVHHAITGSFAPGTEEAANGLYRSQLLQTSLKTATLWGNPTPNPSSLFGHAGQFQLSDVTSQFALMVGRQGIVGLGVWIAFLLALFHVVRVGRRRDDRFLLVLGVALAGEWIALLSVSLITSFQYAFLMTLAVAAARLSSQPTAHEVWHPRP